MSLASYSLPKASNCTNPAKAAADTMPKPYRPAAKKRYQLPEGGRTSFSSSSPSPVLVPLPSPAMSPLLGAVSSFCWGAHSLVFFGIEQRERETEREREIHTYEKRNIYSYIYIYVYISFES